MTDSAFLRLNFRRFHYLVESWADEHGTASEEGEALSLQDIMAW